MPVPSEHSEARSEMLDPHRREEREAAAIEIAGRLLQKGVDPGEEQDAGVLDDALAAVERFEAAVIANGGDPMVNSPGSTDPENPDFVLPARNADESLVTYAERVNSAAESLESRIRE